MQELEKVKLFSRRSSQPVRHRPRQYSDSHLESLPLNKLKVRDAMQRYGGKVKEAASSLGVSRQEFLEWIAVMMVDEIGSHIADNYGLLTPVAQKYGIPRYVLSEIVGLNPLFDAYIADGVEAELDMAEQKLLETIQNGPSSAAIEAIKFLLSTRGKGRGFFHGAIKFDASKLSTEQLRRIRDGENPLDVLQETMTMTIT